MEIPCGSEPAREGVRLSATKTQPTGQLITKPANYYIDIRCLGSNISTYIHCLGSY